MKRLRIVSISLYTSLCPVALGYDTGLIGHKNDETTQKEKQEGDIEERSQEYGGIRSEGTPLGKKISRGGKPCFNVEIYKNYEK